MQGTDENVKQTPRECLLQVIYSFIYSDLELNINRFNHLKSLVLLVFVFVCLFVFWLVYLIKFTLPRSHIYLVSQFILQLFSSSLNPVQLYESNKWMQFLSKRSVQRIYYRQQALYQRNTFTEQLFAVVNKAYLNSNIPRKSLKRSYTVIKVGHNKKQFKSDKYTQNTVPYSRV